jgi:hypothetical protein
MKINLSPQCRDDELSVIVSGDILVLNGEVLDLTPLPEGGTLPRNAVENPWLIGDVIRKDGQIELTLLFPHGFDASEAARFPEPLIVTTNGKVELPA